MKTILSTLLALGVLTGAASAQTFKPFDDITVAVPRATDSDDNFKQALPRGPHDEFNNPSLPLPLTDATFPDITIATP